MPAEDADASADLAWETLDSEIAYTCPGFDIVRQDVRLPDGTETDFDYLHDEPAVVVLPFVATPDGTGDHDDDGDDAVEAGGDRATPQEVVVIEEWRQAVGRVNRGLPAGSSESTDADLRETARRELEEETGYVADSLERLGAFEAANGITDAVHHYFLARGCEPAGEQRLDVDESIRVDTTTLAELRADVRDGDVRDARTALAVLHYELFAQV